MKIPNHPHPCYLRESSTQPLRCSIATISHSKTGYPLIEDSFNQYVPATLGELLGCACVKAGRAANLDYGHENGFTLHSLRHPFIADMMEVSNNDIALVMSWSGHKLLESFRIYLHPDRKGASQLVNNAQRKLLTSHERLSTAGKGYDPTNSVR